MQLQQEYVQLIKFVFSKPTGWNHLSLFYFIHLLLSQDPGILDHAIPHLPTSCPQCTPLIQLVTRPFSALHTCFPSMISTSILSQHSPFCQIVHCASQLHHFQPFPCFACLPVWPIACFLTPSCLRPSGFVSILVWSPRHNFFSDYWAREDCFTRPQPQPAMSACFQSVFLKRLPHTPSLNPDTMLPQSLFIGRLPEHKVTDPVSVWLAEDNGCLHLSHWQLCWLVYCSLTNTGPCSNQMSLTFSSCQSQGNIEYY